MTATKDRVRLGVETLRDDPALYVRKVLGAEPTLAQAPILASIRTNRRTAVKAAPGVGKTAVAAFALLWFAPLFAYSRVITTAPTWQHVQRILWAEVARRYHQAPYPIGGRLEATQLTMGPSWSAYGLSTNNADAFRGAHAEEQLIIFDEAQGIADPIWDAAENLMSGAHCRWLVIGNSHTPSGRFFECFSRPDMWTPFTLSALDHPNVVTGENMIPGAVTREAVEEVRARYGEGSPQWLWQVLGEFPTESGSRLFPIAWLRACATAKPTAKDGAHMGVDPSLGGDETVATLMRDRVVTDQERWQWSDLMATTGRVVQLAQKWNVPARNVHVDSIGIGAGVVARLREQGFSVDAVDFGSDPKGDWRGATGQARFKNRRVELYHVGRELVRTGEICIPDRFRDTVTDLAAVDTLPPDSGGREQLEPKDQIKKRLGRSPDCGDSLILALSRRGNRELGIEWR